MRTFLVEYADKSNWGKWHSVVRVKACTINGAVKRAKKKILRKGSIYQICSRVKGYAILQIVWNYYDGNRSSYYGLKL